MSKRTTKAEIILRGARDRVRDAQEAVVLAEGRLEILNATLTAHQFALDELEKDLLAPTPRKKASPKSPAPAVTRRSSRKPGSEQSTASIEGKENPWSAQSCQLDTSSKCAICGNEETHADHQTDSTVYHLFRTTLKKKNSKDNGGIVLPDNPEDFEEFKNRATA